MSKSAGTSKTVSTTSPAGFQQPYIDKMLSESQRLYESPGPGFYPGSTVAELQPEEKQAQSYLMGAAGDADKFYKNSITPAVGTALKAYDVANDPTLKAASEAAMRPMWQQLTEQALPNIRNSAVSSGGYGGSRQGIAEGLAIRGTSQAAADASARMYEQAREQGLGLLSTTLGQAPALQQMGATPATMMSAVGEQNRAQEQAKIDENVARYNYEQTLPFKKLMDYAQLVSGPYGGTGVQVQEGTGGGGEQTVGALLSALGLAPSVWDSVKGIFGL